MMATMRQLTTIAALLLCLSSLVAAQERDVKFKEEMAKGDAALAKREYGDALKAYKQANANRKGKSRHALHGMARAHFGAGAHGKVVDTCGETLKHVGGDRELEALARNLRASSLVQLSVKADDRRLAQAEQDLLAALQLAPNVLEARYNLGFLLLRTNRDAAGIAMLREFLELAPPPAVAEKARRLIENPRRAREAFAPDFSIVTLEGQRITLDSLRGKTVLLDFWGTWCPPCRAATPDLIRLAKKHADRPFVIVGVSSDENEKVVQDYVQKNRMAWPQFVDAGREVHRAFNVSMFPTYVIIDAEGIVRARRSAFSHEIAMWLNREVERALNAATKDDER
jgi:thiol-disulfide isomerase/thioredoxin